MAILLNSTLISEDANSYCDIAFADDYFSEHFSALKRTTWEALGDGQKQQLLVQACMVIEQFRFTEPTTPQLSSLQWDNVQNRFTAYVPDSVNVGKYSVYQALQFPRNIDIQADGDYYIPERMKMAQCEQAIYLASLDETALANRLQGLNMDRLSLGRGEVQLTQEYFNQGTALSPIAHEWIRPYLIKTSRMQRA
jgi:hypothetical protein